MFCYEAAHTFSHRIKEKRRRRLFSIVTDTGANLTREQIERWNVSVLPMDTDGETTAQVNPFVCEKFLREPAQKGDVLCVCLSGALSGTVRSVQMAASALGSAHTVHVLDSKCAADGEGMLVHLAVQARQSGRSFDETVKLAEKAAMRVCHLFVAGDAQTTARSGRFGETVDEATVLTIDQAGKVVPYRRAANRKAALQTIAQTVHRTALQTGNGVLIAHANNAEDAAYLAGQIGERAEIHALNRLFTAHTGDGTVAVFYPGTLRTNLRI